MEINSLMRYNSYKYLIGGFCSMSLIKCPECGKQVSDKAINCPSCGYNIKNMKNHTQKMKLNKMPIATLLIFFVIILVIIIFVLLFINNSKKKYYSYRVKYTSEDEMLKDLCGTWISCSSDDIYIESYTIYYDNYTYRSIVGDDFDETYEFSLNYKTSEIIHKEHGEIYYDDIIEIDGEKYIRSEGLNHGYVEQEIKPWMLDKKEE